MLVGLWLRWRQLIPVRVQRRQVTGLLLPTLLCWSGPGRWRRSPSLLTIMALARWRFSLPAWTVLLTNCSAWGLFPSGRALYTD